MYFRIVIGSLLFVKRNRDFYFLVMWLEFFLILFVLFVNVDGKIFREIFDYIIRK